MFIREEEDQAAPPLRELVQEQPALATRLGGEHRRVAPHLRPPGGEQTAVPQPHRQRRVKALDRPIEGDRYRLAFRFRRVLVIAVELRRKDQVAPVIRVLPQRQVVPDQFLTVACDSNSSPGLCQSKRDAQPAWLQANRGFFTLG